MVAEGVYLSGTIISPAAPPLPSATDDQTREGGTGLPDAMPGNHRGVVLDVNKDWGGEFDGWGGLKVDLHVEG